MTREERYCYQIAVLASQGAMTKFKGGGWVLGAHVCSSCGGAGLLALSVADPKNNNDVYNCNICPDCGGSGV